jgi:hypothetical protein
VEAGYYQDTQHHGLGTRHIMHMVTGDFPCDIYANGHSNGHLINNNYRQTLLEKGTVINYGQKHMLSIHLRKSNGEWQQVQDNQHGESSDTVLSKITDLRRWARGERGVEENAGGPLRRRRLALDGRDDAIGPVSPNQPERPGLPNQPQVCRPGQPCGPDQPNRPDDQYRPASPFPQHCPDQQQGCRVRCCVPRRRLFRRCG